MKPEELLAVYHTAEKLKCRTRHCDTSSGRRESVAEHCFLLALMAMLSEHEFPGADMNKVVKMCLVHDLGEIFTGDIPTFRKTADDDAKEEAALHEWIAAFPEAERETVTALLCEMEEMQTEEAKIYRAFDKMEGMIQHIESDISTWLPLEYDLQVHYAEKECAETPYTRALWLAVTEASRKKIREAEEKSK